MTRSVLLALVIAACSAPPPMVPGAPPVPLLEPAAAQVYRRAFTLLGAAPGAAVLRLFVDEACAGPVFLEVSSEALAAGLKLDLVEGDNVFSAHAVSSAGLVSACSTPVRVRFVSLPVPVTPQFTVFPSETASTRVFTVKGTVGEYVSVVQLHDLDCQQPVLDTLTPERFRDEGFIITFARDGSRRLALDVLDINGQRSSCAMTFVTSDQTPPERVDLQFRSPTPSNQNSAYLEIYSPDSVEIRLGPECTGPLGALCSQGSCLQVVQFLSPVPQPVQWSAGVTDLAGNTACFAGPPWTYEPMLATEPIELTWNNSRVGGKVPTGRRDVELFATADCTGPWLTVLPVLDFLQSGLYYPGPDDGGVRVLSGHATWPDGTVDPCSSPVTAP